MTPSSYIFLEESKLQLRVHRKISILGIYTMCKILLYRMYKIMYKILLNHMWSLLFVFCLMQKPSCNEQTTHSLLQQNKRKWRILFEFGFNPRWAMPNLITFNLEYTLSCSTNEVEFQLRSFSHTGTTVYRFLFIIRVSSELVFNVPNSTRSPGRSSKHFSARSLRSICLSQQSSFHHLVPLEQA